MLKTNVSRPVRPNIPPVHVLSTGSSKSHTATWDIQAFCQKVNKHPLKAFDLRTKINKGKLKWRPNLKLRMKRLWSCWAINQRPWDVFSAGLARSELCAASCFNMQANQDKQKQKYQIFQNIFLCAFDRLQCSHHGIISQKGESNGWWIIVKRIWGVKALNPNTVFNHWHFTHLPKPYKKNIQKVFRLYCY